MKQTALLFYLLLFFATAFSQKTEFEGYVVYRNEITSKVEGVSNKAYKSLLLLGDSSRAYLKNGNSRFSNPLCETYYINKDQKAYLKFKGIDTLYYRPYGDDTTEVIKTAKLRGTKQIAGYTCNGMSVKLADREKQYFYAPSLYLDPIHEQNNRLGRYDVFAKEAASVWLEMVEETRSYILTETSLRVQPATLADSLFQLPDLPRKIFTYESVSTEAVFAGSGGWQAFLSRNIDAQLGAKYVRVPKGAKSGTEQVLVKFIISERGRLLNPEVVNPKEVHPKLAAEALRVVSISPLWKPATAFGEKIPSYIIQPISFAVEVQ